MDDWNLMRHHFIAGRGSSYGYNNGWMIEVWRCDIFFGGRSGGLIYLACPLFDVILEDFE